MFSWIYQLLLSFVARVLSWFGLSFSAKEIQDVTETVQSVQSVSENKEDAPELPQNVSGPQPYSVESSQEVLA